MLRYTDDRTINGGAWVNGGICGSGMPIIPTEDNLPYINFLSFVEKFYLTPRRQGEGGYIATSLIHLSGNNFYIQFNAAGNKSVVVDLNKVYPGLLNVSHTAGRSPLLHVGRYFPLWRGASADNSSRPTICQFNPPASLAMRKFEKVGDDEKMEGGWSVGVRAGREMDLFFCADACREDIFCQSFAWNAAGSNCQNYGLVPTHPGAQFIAEAGTQIWVSA